MKCKSNFQTVSEKKELEITSSYTERILAQKGYFVDRMPKQSADRLAPAKAHAPVPEIVLA